MERLYNASHTYLANLEKMRHMAKHGPAAPTISSMPQPGKAQTLEHPQYYLAMIAWRDENDWSLRINGHLYTAQNPEFGELRVLEADKTKARFRWQPEAFSVYEDRLPADADAQGIVLKKDDEAFEFTLYTNQSFSAYSMTVEEGYLPPVRVEQFTTDVNISMDQGGGDLNAVRKGGLQPLPSSGMYDMPGKDEINKELSGGR